MLRHVCTVCKGSFRISKKWLDHLLLEEHQAKAREAILKWGKAMRGCTFIVYSNLPVARSEVLLLFSNKGFLVTDFVWFPSNPLVGFVQFESKKLANKAFAGVEAPRVKICDQIVEMKKACECLTLEWDERVSSLSSPTNREQFVGSTEDVQSEDPDEMDTSGGPIDKPKAHPEVSGSGPMLIQQSAPARACGIKEEEDDDCTIVSPPPKPQEKPKRRRKAASKARDCSFGGKDFDPLGVLCFNFNNETEFEAIDDVPLFMRKKFKRFDPIEYDMMKRQI